MKWDKLNFYVENTSDRINLKILSKELSDFTISQILEMIEEYVEFRNHYQMKIDLIDYIKIFVV